jgi:hypothetical protein
MRGGIAALILLAACGVDPAGMVLQDAGPFMAYDAGPVDGGCAGRCAQDRTDCQTWTAECVTRLIQVCKDQCALTWSSNPGLSDCNTDCENTTEGRNGAPSISSWNALCSLNVTRPQDSYADSQSPACHEFGTCCE